MAQQPGDPAAIEAEIDHIRSLGLDGGSRSARAPRPMASVRRCARPVEIDELDGHSPNPFA